MRVEKKKREVINKMELAEGTNLNFAAIIACIFNTELSSTTALEKMGFKMEREMGIYDPRRKRKLDDSLAPEIKRIYESREISLIDLGKLYGMSGPGMGLYLKHNGIATRRAGRYVK